MEDLNKNQLILLTLLVSFVTSIATGIITVSLLQEAPTTVTQTINRVIERTIEQVVPETDGGGTTVTREVTVVVTEEDQVIDAIAKNAKSIVRIVRGDSTDASGFYGIGVVLSRTGHIVVPLRDSFNNRIAYSAILSNGTRVPLTFLGRDESEQFLFFKAEPEAGTGLDVAVATFVKESPQLGQSVIALEGESSNVVAIGRVSQFIQRPSFDGIFGIETDITPKSSAIGAPLLTLSGEVTGFRTRETGPGGSQIYRTPASLSDAFAQYLAQ